MPTKSQFERNRGLARDSLSAYAAVMFPKFDYAPHTAIICDALEAVDRGEISRLMINMPPRHGKSMITSELFPAWWLGRNPTDSIIATSYSDRLATDFGRKVRNHVSSRLHKAIFGSQIAKDSDSVSRFHLTTEGSYFAVSVGGTLTGRGANLLLIDDPVKSAEEARSVAYRRSLQEWYQSVAYTRLQPVGAVIVIQTRWHEDDLAGYLLREHAQENWTVINLPAVAESDETFRKVGDALWPERYSLESLARIREAIGTNAWASLYQQRPVADGGNIIKRDWLRPYSGANEFGRTIFAMDTAYGKSQTSGDYSAIVCLSEAKNGYYVRFVSRGRWDFPTLKRQLAALYELWKPCAIICEDAASGASLIQELKTTTRLPLLPVKPQGSDKIARCNSIAPMCESGKVFIPTEAAWLNDFIDELVSFPAGKHDDQCDAFVYGLSYLRGAGWDGETFRETARHHAANMAARRSGVGYGQMIMNSADADAIEYGTTGRTGARYTNVARVRRGLGGF